MSRTVADAVGRFDGAEAPPVGNHLPAVVMDGLLRLERLPQHDAYNEALRPVVQLVDVNDSELV
ncbi:MAG: hypothetical protein F4076_13195 [Acidimicrobiaceae bacterium]|nr:hypothetical protein [Acidimicrobiaceae bacterium]MYH42301.1 hypothetical protein [Acidimicrobiaceae bacterium]MYJ43369.1 hypothetical protein [Acidimicrobiaceae bacterium]